MGELRKLEIKEIPNLNEKDLGKKTEKLFEELKNVEVINNKSRNGEVVESSFYEEEEAFEIEDGEESIKFNFKYVSFFFLFFRFYYMIVIHCN